MLGVDFIKTMVFCGFRLFTRVLSQLLRDCVLGPRGALKTQKMVMSSLAPGPNPVSHLSGSTTGNDNGSTCQASWLETALPTPFVYRPCTAVFEGVAVEESAPLRRTCSRMYLYS